MKCLLAVHLHEGAEDLVEQASAWASRMRAKLDLAFVDEYNYDLMLIDDPSVRTVLDRQWAEVRKRQRERLEELVATLPETVRGLPIPLQGRAAPEIIAAAKGYDLLVIGTHGRTGIGHLLLGSVAERVVRLAKLPVMVLRVDEAT